MATVDTASSLISVLSDYTITATDGAVVTIGSSSSGLITALGTSTFNANGGTIIVGAATLTALSTTTYTISNDGTLELSTNGSAAAVAALSGSSVTFGTGGGTLILTPGGNLGLFTGFVIEGFSADDTIEVTGASSITSVVPSGTDTEVTFDTGVSILLSGSYTAAQLQASVVDGTLDITTCFLAGTMIETAEGAVAVENIVIGDRVIVFNHRADRHEEKAVTWVGSRSATVRPWLPDDLAGYPVRILKDAIADGVPCKDLLVTPEHCLFFSDCLVPARMLVNGRSVFYDRSFTSYEYYHVETEEHSILTADGMLTESYLDTGNGQAFRRAGNVVALRPEAKSWESDAAAPLMVSCDRVRPLSQRIEARAVALGIDDGRAVAALTEDADLHLVCERGSVIRPVRRVQDRFMFVLPPGVSRVVVASRASRPSDVVGAFMDDRRWLGVLVGDVTLFDAGGAVSVSEHLRDAALAGWDVLEASGCRWTNGRAALALGDRGGLAVLGCWAFRCLRVVLIGLRRVRGGFF